MIALLAAFQFELRALCRRMTPQRIPGRDGGILYRGSLPSGEEIAVAFSGMGIQRASEAASWLLQTTRPSLVLSVGTCGALSDRLDTGHVVVPDAVQLLSLTGDDLFPDEPVPIESELHRSLVLARARAGLRGIEGTLVSSDRIVRTIQEKKALSEIPGLTAVDMESIGVAMAAQDHQVPFGAVRVVLDRVWDEVRVDYDRLTRGRPDPSLWDALTYLAIRPGKWGPFSRDARRAMHATACLQTYLHALLEQRALYA